MKAVNKRYLTTIVSIWFGFFILLLLVNLIVLMPQRNRSKHLEKQVSEKKRIFEQALEVGDYDNQLRLDKEIKQLRSELDRFVNAFDNLSNLTFEIRQIAGKGNVDSFSIKAKDGYKGLAIPHCNYIRESRIDTSFLSDFNQFANFINSLERHKPVIFVDTFTVKRSDKQNIAHKARVNLSVFVKKPQGT